MHDKIRKFEYYEKRFGGIAFKKGFITSKDLLKAIGIQVREDLEKKPHRLLGTILMDMDLITANQIHGVLHDLFDTKKC